MQSFAIGISGLEAAQRALDVIGNNIANAATPGYHRQRIDLVSSYSCAGGGIAWGGGVDVAGVTRLIDRLLEQEILRQGSSLGQASQELSTLSTIESALGEFSAGSGLSTVLDDFFSALRDLSAYPSEATWQSQAVSAAETLAAQFQTLGTFLDELQDQISLQADAVVKQVNALINQIAELNASIQKIEISSGGEASNLRDQRDQRITELSELAGVETRDGDDGVVNVSIAGIPVVTGAIVMEIRVGVVENGYLGIAPAASHNYTSSVQGGQLGGLLTLGNETVRDIRQQMDSLALAVIRQINQYHVQGVGAEGSFTELTGWTMPDEELSALGSQVSDGRIYIRVTNTDTGEITRHEIPVNISQESPDTLTSLAAKIDAIEGLSASVVSSGLHIEAQTGYEFDFLPAVLPAPTTSSLTGASPPSVSVSGTYTGSTNDTWTVTVLSSGSVSNDDLRLEVKNSEGEVIKTMNIGAGYAAGDSVEVADGVEISLASGDLNEGDAFTIDVFASTDTSGVLAAVGINTFFKGSGASDMAVCSDIVDSPGRIATALGPELTDNVNALRLAAVRDEAQESLDGLTPGEFYSRLVTDVGQQVSVGQSSYDNIEAVIQNLSKRQSEVSGVDINDEAAQLLMFEQMFQAMAKYMSTVQSAMETMMEIL